MRTNSRTLGQWIAVVCLGLAPGAQAGDPASDPLPFRDEAICSDSKSSAGMPAKSNRACGIVGMEVRNQVGEHLGRIKDLVLDLNTERVSYAVISTRPKGIFTSREKLLAVPLNALTASADGQHVVLNAEKSKVDDAIGFDRNHWPSGATPTWGAEPCWQKATSTSGTRYESAEDPESIANPDMGPGPDRQRLGARVNRVPSVSPALDSSPGGLAWSGW